MSGSSEEDRLVKAITSSVIVDSKGEVIEPGNFSTGELLSYASILSKNVSKQEEQNATTTVTVKSDNEFDCSNCSSDESTDFSDNSIWTDDFTMPNNKWEDVDKYVYEKNNEHNWVTDETCRCYMPPIGFILMLKSMAFMVFERFSTFLNDSCRHFNHIPGPAPPSSYSEKCKLCLKKNWEGNYACYHYYKRCLECHRTFIILLEKIKYFNDRYTSFQRTLENLVDFHDKKQCLSRSDIFPDYPNLHQGNRSMMNYEEACKVKNFLLINLPNWHTMKETCLIGTKCRECINYVLDVGKQRAYFLEKFSKVLPAITIRAHVCSFQEPKPYASDFNKSGFQLFMCVACRVELTAQLVAALTPQYDMDEYSELLLLVNFIVSRLTTKQLKFHRCTSKRPYCLCVFCPYVYFGSTLTARNFTVCENCLHKCKFLLTMKTAPLIELRTRWSLDVPSDWNHNYRYPIDTQFLVYCYDSDNKAKTMWTNIFHDEPNGGDNKKALKELGYFWDEDSVLRKTTADEQEE